MSGFGSNNAGIRNEECAREIDYVRLLFRERSSLSLDRVHFSFIFYLNFF